MDFARLNHSTISFFNFSKPETASSRWNRVSLNASKVWILLFCIIIIIFGVCNLWVWILIEQNKFVRYSLGNLWFVLVFSCRLVEDGSGVVFLSFFFFLELISFMKILDFIDQVGKGLSKDVKAQKLAFQHWIEAVMNFFSYF